MLAVLWRAESMRRCCIRDGGTAPEGRIPARCGRRSRPTASRARKRS